ncbi:MAG TPA: NrsF family protein [Kofleriaceae bacterium]|nr:NrsF family protein [Kofleriaceae bacterium]
MSELPAIPVPRAPPVSSALEAELGQLVPVRTRQPLRQLAMLAIASLIYSAVLVYVLAMRTDLDDLPVSGLAAVAAAWLFGFLVPCYLALVPRAGTMSPRLALLIAVVVVASIGFVMLGLVVHPMSPSLSVVYGSEHFGRGHTCLEVGLATALLPVIVGAVFLRGALPVGARWVGAALGAGGGCLGGLVLHLHCNVADGLHVGLVHGGVVVLSALLSAAIVPRATDRR